MAKRPGQAEETRHVVQPYKLKKGGGLVAADVFVARNAIAAQDRARKLYATGRFAGVDAYTATNDPEAGEYGEPVFLARLGRVPEYGD